MDQQWNQGLVAQLCETSSSAFQQGQLEQGSEQRLVRVPFTLSHRGYVADFSISPSRDNDRADNLAAGGQRSNDEDSHFGSRTREAAGLSVSY